jgi:hypothetical protein
MALPVTLGLLHLASRNLISSTLILKVISLDGAVFAVVVYSGAFECIVLSNMKNPRRRGLISTIDATDRPGAGGAPRSRRVRRLRPRIKERHLCHRGQQCRIIRTCMAVFSFGVRGVKVKVR